MSKKLYSAKRHNRVKIDTIDRTIKRRHQRPVNQLGTLRFSKYGFNMSGDAQPDRIPYAGPGNRKVPMTLPTLKLPPAYEDEL